MHYVPPLCNHCDEAACIEACKVEGALYKREDGLVIIDPEKCTGCKQLRERLPLPRHLHEREPQHRPEVHGVRPPPRQRTSGRSRAAWTPAPPELSSSWKKTEAREFVTNAEVLHPE